MQNGQEEVGGGPYSCKREEDDGTIGLSDVDYYCESHTVIPSGYWIGTDGHKITALQSAG
jgi:hypothetical protein